MADAWQTVVTREPEYDDYTRSRLLALDTWESDRCPTCGCYDVLVRVKTESKGHRKVTTDRNVRWAEHDNRAFRVEQFRCLACGAVAAVERDWNKDHENDPPAKGRVAPGDGRIFLARPLDEDDEEVRQ